MIPIEQRIERHRIPEVMLTAATIYAAYITADNGIDSRTVHRACVSDAVKLLRECEMRVDDTLAEEVPDTTDDPTTGTVGESLGDYIESIAEHIGYTVTTMSSSDATLGDVRVFVEHDFKTLTDMLHKATTYARAATVISSLDQDDEAERNAELRAAATEALAILNDQSPGSGPIQQTAYRLWRALGLNTKPDGDPDDDRGPVIDDDQADGVDIPVDTEPARTAVDALADTVKQFAKPTAESLLPPGPLLACYTFDHVEHMLKTYAGKAPKSRAFRLRLPYYWLAAGTLMLRDVKGEYFVTMPDDAYIAAEINGGTPRLTAETVLSNPHIFEELFPEQSRLRSASHTAFGHRMSSIAPGNLEITIDSAIGDSIRAGIPEAQARESYADRLRREFDTDTADRYREGLDGAQVVTRWPAGESIEDLLNWAKVSSIVFARDYSDHTEGAPLRYVCYLNSTTAFKGGQAKGGGDTVERALLDGMTAGGFGPAADLLLSRSTPRQFIVPAGAATEISRSALHLFMVIDEALEIVDEEGSSGANSIARKVRSARKDFRRALVGLEPRI